MIVTLVGLQLRFDARAAHAMKPVAAGDEFAFDLAPLASQAFVTLSGGERQRARLAQLWAQNPPLMLLDEPLQHLDLRHQLQTLALLRQATREAGGAAALVLHDLTFAGRCDRILMLYGDGRYAAGSAVELLVSQIEGGDHVLFIGRVARLWQDDRDALMFYRGRYLRPAEVTGA